jgi:hypothetical protein
VAPFRSTNPPTAERLTERLMRMRDVGELAHKIKHPRSAATSTGSSPAARPETSTGPDQFLAESIEIYRAVADPAS